MDPLIIVGRYKGAFEHPSEEARKKYLQEHPKADPKNHTVKQHDDHGGGDEEEKPEHDKSDQEHGEGKKPSGGFFKGLSSKAKSFLSHSSAAVQKFVADGDHRKKVLKSATQSIKDSPKVYAKRILETVKEEVHEFKEAGEAIKHAAQGKELNPHQKKALRTVAIHMSVAITAAALGSTGVLAGATMLGKGIAQKIALKAALKSLEHVHLLSEISHIGHHLHHFLASEDAKGKLDPEEAFTALVMQMTLKELENLDDDTLSEALEDASGEQEKKAWKVGALSHADLAPTLQRAANQVVNLRAWIDRFDRTLLVARSESETIGPERVWQDRFVKYFEQAEPFTTELEAIDDVLDDIYLDDEKAAGIANQARQIIQIPRKAQVTYAIADIDFADNPNTGRQGISYSVERLKDWAAQMNSWAQSVPGKLLDLSRRAGRIRP